MTTESLPRLPHLWEADADSGVTNGSGSGHVINEFPLKQEGDITHFSEGQTAQKSSHKVSSKMTQEIKARCLARRSEFKSLGPTWMK